MDELRRARRNFSSRALGAAPDVDRVLAGPARSGLDDASVLRLPARAGPPVQVVDPASPDFGKNYFLLGFDHIGGDWVLR
jgi:hypothetical protein